MYVERQVDDRVTTRNAVNRTAVRTCGVQHLASEEVCLAFENVGCVSNSDVARYGRRRYFQREVDDAVASATDLLQSIRSCFAVGSEQLAAEQIFLSRLYRCGVGGSFVLDHKQVQMNRTVAERVGCRTA